MSQAPLHPSTFEYLNPSDIQKSKMATAREATRQYANVLQDVVPEGADRTYLLRKLREVAMWANVAISRNSDGSPRSDDSIPF